MWARPVALLRTKPSAAALPLARNTTIGRRPVCVRVSIRSSASALFSTKEYSTATPASAAAAATSAAGVTSSCSTSSQFEVKLAVHDLASAHAFYSGIVGLDLVKKTPSTLAFSLFGHQLVLEKSSPDFRATDFYNSVDRDDVPVPHFGVCLSVEQFHSLADHLSSKGVHFVVKPHLRFSGAPGEQWTMFFKDPSNNSLEFKAMTTPQNLFARYEVR